MTKIEFIARYMLIEQYLYSLLPEFNAENRMGDLLDLLRQENKITNTLLNDMIEVLKLRNRLVGEHGTETPVPEEMANKIITIKNTIRI